MRLATTLFLIAAATPALAGTKAGVTMPDTITVAGKPLVLNGMGLREATILDIDVYVAGLYVEHASSNPGDLIGSNQVKRIVLQFVRDVDRGDIVKAWNEGFAHDATVPAAQLRPMIDQLDAWMPDMKSGHTLMFTYVPGQGVAVDVDGTRKGVLQGDDFARSLFSIWLGPKPPNKALKRGLLGDHKPQA
jgi:hypothetical protein